MKLAITFGCKYDYPSEPRHPASSEITGHSFVVFEGDSWHDTRAMALKALGTVPGYASIANWAFDYDYESESFQDQIRKYNLREVILDNPAG